MFILFRIFDITKPYPANYYEKILRMVWGNNGRHLCRSICGCIIGSLHDFKMKKKLIKIFKVLKEKK